MLPIPEKTMAWFYVYSIYGIVILILLWNQMWNGRATNKITCYRLVTLTTMIIIFQHRCFKVFCVQEKIFKIQSQVWPDCGSTSVSGKFEIYSTVCKLANTKRGDQKKEAWIASQLFESSFLPLPLFIAIRTGNWSSL